MEPEQGTKYQMTIKWGRKKLNFTLDTEDDFETFKGKATIFLLDKIALKAKFLEYQSLTLSKNIFFNIGSS